MALFHQFQTRIHTCGKLPHLRLQLYIKSLDIFRVFKIFNHNSINLFHGNN